MRRIPRTVSRWIGAVWNALVARIGVSRGRFRLLRGDLPGAIARLEKATKRSPGGFDGFLHLSRAYLRANDLGRARRSIARAREASAWRFAREMPRWVRREGFELSALTDLGPPARVEAPAEREAAVLHARHRSEGALPFGDCRDLDEYARFRSMPPISEAERETCDWDEIAEDLQDG
jgi:hypothetical protein